MRALVTGGAGFIGSNIVMELVARGHEAAVLDDLSSGYPENVPSGVELVRGDVRDEALMQRLAHGRDVIIHLAASVGNKRSIDHPILDSEINVLGTLRVLEAARHAGISHVVFSSSAGIFGELKTLPIREDHPCEPDSPYGASKLAAEKMCLAYNKLYGMKNVCLRYFNVFGPHQRFDAYGNVIPIFAERMLRGQEVTVFGDGEQTRDFVHVRDVAAANLAAAQAASGGAFNIGSGSRITINELVHVMGSHGANPPRVVHGPPRAGDVRHSLADVSAARAALGWAPRESLGACLKEYLDWLASDPITLRSWEAQ